VTLVQVLADEISIHMACDFRLTDPVTKQVRQDNAHKLIEVRTPRISAIIGVTGVAILDGKPVGRWIAEIAADLDGKAHLDDLVEVLRQRAEVSLAQVRDDRWRRTTFVVTGIIGSQTIVTFISNFEGFAGGRVERSDVADHTLSVSSTRPKRAQLFVAGAVDAVTVDDRAQLELMLRAQVPDAQIQERLSEINAAASRRSPTVSAGCYVASLHATGRGSSQPFLTDDQQGDFIPPDAEELFRRMGFRIKSAIGPDGKPMPIRVVGSTSVFTRPSDKYFREQLKLDPNSAELWNNKGVYLNERKRHGEAADAFRRAVSLDDSYAIAIANLAKTTWRHQGDIGEAERLYVAAVEIPEPPTPAWMLSDFADFCDEALEDPSRALDLHRRAAEDETYSIAKARLAYFMLKHRQDTERADSFFAELLAREPENAAILLLSGQADWFFKGDRDSARTKLLKACTLNPNDAHSLNLAGAISLATGDAFSSAYYFRKAMKRGVGGWVVEMNCGMALLLEGKPDGALRRLNRAKKQASATKPPIQLGIAATLWSLARRGESATLLREVLKSSPQPKIELESLAMLAAVGLATEEETRRLSELIDEGCRTDGQLIRNMVRKLPRSDRDAGLTIADQVEGDGPLPPTFV
jgi:Tfp pilus assembly protein PilF